MTEFVTEPFDVGTLRLLLLVLAVIAALAWLYYKIMKGK